MGNDLLLNYIWWSTEQPPDWAGARKHIEALPDETLFQHPEFEVHYWLFGDGTDSEAESVDEFRKYLLACHDGIVKLIDGGGDRHSYIITIGKYSVLISPSNAFYTLQTWMEIEGLDQFGFFPDWRGPENVTTNSSD